MAELKAEIINAYIKVEGASHSIYVDEATSLAIRDSAWASMEASLIEANAAYNGDTEAFDRIRTLRDSLSEALRYADVVLELTPLPDEPDTEA